MMSLSVTGPRSNGEIYTGQIHLPSPYALLMMKLFALRDQWENAAKGYGRKHAMDLYTLIALTTEPEYQVCQELSRRYRASAEGREATRIVEVLFAEETGPGILRMKEHGTLPPDADIVMFLSLLREFFPPEGTEETSGTPQHP